MPSENIVKTIVKSCLMCVLVIVVSSGAQRMDAHQEAADWFPAQGYAGAPRIDHALTDLNFYID